MVQKVVYLHFLSLDVGRKKFCLIYYSVLLEHQAPIILHYYTLMAANTNVLKSQGAAPLPPSPRLRSGSQTARQEPPLAPRVLQGWETKKGGRWWKGPADPLGSTCTTWKSLHLVPSWKGRPSPSDVFPPQTFFFFFFFLFLLNPRMHCSSCARVRVHILVAGVLVSKLEEPGHRVATSITTRRVCPDAVHMGSRSAPSAFQFV